MFGGLLAFGHSLASFLDPWSIGLILLSSLVGVVIGALPGLTATMGVALMTTLTIKMPPNEALPSSGWSRSGGALRTPWRR